MDDDPVLRAQIADERVEAALLATQFPTRASCPPISGAVPR
ncbi:hypothetical protein AB0N14_36070 [Streptomyces sp. NPDC051104]